MALGTGSGASPSAGERRTQSQVACFAATRVEPGHEGELANTHATHACRAHAPLYPARFQSTLRAGGSTAAVGGQRRTGGCAAAGAAASPAAHWSSVSAFLSGSGSAASMLSDAHVLTAEPRGLTPHTDLRAAPAAVPWLIAPCAFVIGNARQSPRGCSQCTMPKPCCLAAACAAPFTACYDRRDSADISHRVQEGLAQAVAMSLLV